MKELELMILVGSRFDENWRNFGLDLRREKVVQDDY